jgi:Ni/Co efflux regulator RcnB
MKRIILSVLVFSMLAATSLQGQAAPMNMPAQPQGNYAQVDWKKPAHRYDDRRVEKRVIVKKRKVVKRHYWKRGERYADWRRHRPVRDYHRYGLRRPGHNQEWIRVGNDYLLVGVATGVIAGLIAGR